MKMGNIKSESTPEMKKKEKKKKWWFVFPKIIYCRCGKIEMKQEEKNCNSVTKLLSYMF